MLLSHLIVLIIRLVSSEAITFSLCYCALFLVIIRCLVRLAIGCLARLVYVIWEL